jgi:N-acylethanolamine-hydrolysing acid amidase
MLRSTLLILSLLIYLGYGIHPLSVVTIDFDAEPETRWVGAWNAVMKRYGWNNSFGPVFKYHNQTDFAPLTSDMYNRIGSSIEKYWPIYARELKGLA